MLYIAGTAIEFTAPNFHVIDISLPFTVVSNNSGAKSAGNHSDKNSISWNMRIFIVTINHISAMLVIVN